MGIRPSAETRAKMTASHIKRHALHPEFAEKSRMSPPSSLGYHWKKTDEQLKNKMGEKNPSWRGGITPINKAIRNSQKYADWRTKVFERDNYTCAECGEKGVYLHADHIKPFAAYPTLRFEISNGRALCVPCHRATPTFAGRTRNLIAI